MKLYYITDSIMDDRIVHASHIDEVCKNLLRLGHDVRLYAPASPLGSPKQYPTTFIAAPSFLRSLLYQVKLFFRLWRDIARERPDIVYCRQSQYLFVPGIVARITGIPRVIEVNGRLLEEMRQNEKSLIAKVLLALGMFNLIEHMNIRLAAGIIVVSPGIKDYLIATYGVHPTRIAVIPNGVDTDTFKPLPTAEARKRINLEQDPTYVGYIGSLHSWQGLQYVAEAVPLVCAKRPDVRFFIVGDGADTDHLSDFIKANRLESSIDLRPSVSHDLAPLYINAMDICLSYPLKVRASAASPFKVYEYLSCGKPVIVSDIGGIREEFGASVCYAEAESPQALAEAVLSLVDRKNDWGMIERVGRAFIEEGHSWRTVAEATAAFCETIR